MKFLLFILSLTVWIVPTATAQQPDNTTYHCEVQGHSVFPRYEADQQQVVLVSWNTGETIQVLETGFTTTDFSPLEWSQDCRFLLIELDLQRVIAWNVAENRRLGVIEAMPSSLMWSPDQNYALVQTKQGGFLWNLSAGQLFQLNSAANDRGQNFYDSYNYTNKQNLAWDMARHQLLAVSLDNSTGVTAYDLNTGQPVAFYHVGNRSGGVSFTLQGDEILVTSSLGTVREMGMALWNRTTNSVIQLDPAAIRGGVVRYAAPTRWLYSGHYLIVSHRDVYVWDLQNLGAEPYAPLYRFEIYDMMYPYVRMADDQTLEAVGLRYSWHGWAYYQLYRWDLATGTRLTKAWGYEGDCYNAEYRASYREPVLQDWACELLMN